MTILKETTQHSAKMGWSDLSLHLKIPIVGGWLGVIGFVIGFLLGLT